MSARREFLKTGLIGGGVGIAVLLIIFGLAKHWYGSPVSPVVLLLSPGAFIGLLNPPSSELYFVVAFVVQALCYAIAALLIRAAWRRFAPKGTDAV